MFISGIVRKASTFLGLADSEEDEIIRTKSKAGNSHSPRKQKREGEVVFTKNNVCVHIGNNRNNDNEETYHYPGYLVLETFPDQVLGQTLQLSWTPNSALEKRPELSPGVAFKSPRKSSKSSTVLEDTQVHHKSHQSSSSVTSIEMAGDQLTVVTEASVFGVGDEKEDTSASVKLKNSDVNRDSSYSTKPAVLPQDEGSKNYIKISDSSDKAPTKSASIYPTQESNPNIGLTCTHSSHEANASTESSPWEATTSPDTSKTCAHPSVEKVKPTSAKAGNSENPVSFEPSLSKANPTTTISDTRVHPPLVTVKEASVEEAEGTPEESESGAFHQGTCDTDGSSSTSGPDSRPPSPIEGYLPMPAPDLSGLSEATGASHTPPVLASGGASPAAGLSRRMPSLGVFTVNLAQMRSVKLFFSAVAEDQGQVVVASEESQYKILHFHTGGMHRFAQTLSRHRFLKPEAQGRSGEGSCQKFSIVQPGPVHDHHVHPEEAKYKRLTKKGLLSRYMDEEGRVEDDLAVRKHVFFGGVCPKSRKVLWPLLLYHLPWGATWEEREALRQDRYLQYCDVRNIREELSEEERGVFETNVATLVEKDVVRTDRTNPYYRGDDNPNVDTLKNILLNYCLYNPVHSYTQGMTDLLAPILAELRNESDAFWCFVGLMQKTLFVSTPTDTDMDKQLVPGGGRGDYYRELLKLFLPDFYQYLCDIQEDRDLLFMHRWMLLCFKREFPETTALVIWEACWANYQTDYFHLFIALALTEVYGVDIAQQRLPGDQLLLHFNSLAMHMDGTLVLRKARSYMHRFRVLETIPCTLSQLCVLCGPGMWDCGHVPRVRCAGHPAHHPCPYYLNSPAVDPDGVAAASAGD